MKKIMTGSIFLLLVFGAFLWAAKIDISGQTGQERITRVQEKAPEAVLNNQEKLEAILKNAREYCEKVKKATLNYICI